MKYLLICDLKINEDSYIVGIGAHILLCQFKLRGIYRLVSV